MPVSKRKKPKADDLLAMFEALPPAEQAKFRGAMEAATLHENEWVTLAVAEQILGVHRRTVLRWRMNHILHYEPGRGVSVVSVLKVILNQLQNDLRAYRKKHHIQAKVNRVPDALAVLDQLDHLLRQ
jgi:hypothetical protein